MDIVQGGPAGRAEFGSTTAQGERSTIRRLVLPFAVMMLSIYCSTGTLSPTNLITAPEINIVDSCGYLWNCDHDIHKAIFNFLDGTDPSGSILVRRPLFAVIGFPLMKWLGFEVGGVVTSFLLHALAYWFLCLVLLRTMGATASLAVAWLLSTYPGVSYWAGMPYTYMTIVPGSAAIGALMLLMTRTNQVRSLFLLSLLIGLIFLGYDLYSIFLPAVVLLTFYRYRSPSRLLAVTIPMIAPIAAWLLYVRRLGISLENSNSELYTMILDGYSKGITALDFEGFLTRLADLPRIAFANYIYSNFCALPIAVLLALAWLSANARRGVARFLATDAGQVASTIFVSTLALLVFINLNPAGQLNTRWDVRGTWISRLYLPSFVAYFILIAHVFSVSARSGLLGGTRLALLVSVVAFNALISFGPILGDPLGISSNWYANFYTNGPTVPPIPHYVTDNLDRVGRRPLGFCVRP